MRLFTWSAAVVLASTLNGLALAQSPSNAVRQVPIHPVEIENSGPTPDLEGALNALTAAVQQGFTAIGNGLTTGFTAIGNGLTQLGNGMTQGFNALGGALTNLGNGVSAGFTAIGNGLQAGFTGLGNALQASNTAILGAISAHDAHMTQQNQAILAGLQAIGEAIKNIATDNLRFHIEHALSMPEDLEGQMRTNRVVLYEMPQAVGGHLEVVRLICADCIGKLQNSGQVIPADAVTELQLGDTDFAAGNFKSAFDHYRRSYQAASFF